MLTRSILFLPLCLSICVTPVFAQEEGGGIEELLPNLLLNRVILAPSGTGVDHSLHFQEPSELTSLPFLFNDTLVAQLARIPIGSSSGGFTFRFDPAAGTFTRSTPTFGPSFAERAVSVGKGKATFGFNYQVATYDGFEGKDLDGEIKFYLRHVASTNPPAFYEGDVVEETLHLDVSTSSSTFFGSYGVTDRLDVAAAIPIGHISMDASVDARILRLATQTLSGIHQFPNGTDSATFSDSGSASGIGDILLRSKYVFAAREHGGLAAGVEIRLPTGDPDNLLGTGAAAATPMLIGSNRYGRYSPHFNVAYTFAGRHHTFLGDEFQYVVGTEFEASPRVTITGDVIGRVLQDSGRLRETTTTLAFQSAAGVAGTTTVQEFAFEDANLNVITGVIGGKINLFGTFLLSGNVLFPLKKSGIYDNITPVVGIDYVF